MGSDKKIKKKCCGKFRKKGKHCSSCPVTNREGKCKPDKKFCTECEVPDRDKKKKKVKKKAKKTGNR